LLDRLNMRPSHEMEPEAKRNPADNPHEAEIQRILRQNEIVFRTFLICGLLVCALVLIAMLAMLK
jgi:hypothetical protein